jgi:hypothetical protein
MSRLIFLFLFTEKIWHFFVIVRMPKALAAKGTWQIAQLLMHIAKRLLQPGLFSIYNLHIIYTLNAYQSFSG